MKFTIRDLLWLTVVVAICVWLWLYDQRCRKELHLYQLQIEERDKTIEGYKTQEPAYRAESLDSMFRRLNGS